MSTVSGGTPSSFTNATVNGVAMTSPVTIDGTTMLPTAIGAPVTRSLSLATAYQASTPTKPALLKVEITCVTTVGVGSPQTNTIELRIGPNNTVASGGGTRADVFRSDLSVTLISLGWTSQGVLRAEIPAGYYFSINRTVGSGTSIVTAYDQALD